LLSNYKKVNKKTGPTHACLTTPLFRYPEVNYMFCNGATFSVTGINWKRSFEMLFTDTVGLVEKAEAASQIRGEITKDGMGKMFQVNVFAHYVMVKNPHKIYGIN
jgi:hypothetical protein